VFPEERLLRYPVSENDGEERPRFSAREKKREKDKRHTPRDEKKENILFDFLSRFLSKKAD